MAGVPRGLLFVNYRRGRWCVHTPIEGFWALPTEPTCPPAKEGKDGRGLRTQAQNNQPNGLFGGSMIR